MENKEYELLVIINPEAEQVAGTVMAKIKELLEKHGGSVLNTDDWGKRKLAYPIRKFEFGYYVIFKISLPGENVPAFERDLLLAEEIIRFMITKPEDLSKNKGRKTTTLKEEEVSNEGL